MKTWLMALLMVGLAATWMPTTSEAKRLGGGRPAGMQRTAPDKAAQPTPATPAATPGTPGAPAAAAAPTRSWLGPIAGLAAGLGLAALFSHLGMGEEFANVVMLMLLAVVGVAVIRWLMQRFATGGARAAPLGTAAAGAGAAGSAGSSRLDFLRAPPGAPAAPQPVALPSSTAAAVSPPATLPADFDAAAFQRIAKMIFVRLQAANDSADLNDLRAFTTPELFASLRVDLQERGSAAQQTDVMTLEAELLDFAQENDLQIVSVRFHGLMREDVQHGAAPFDEVWHLVRPLDGSRSWAIAGIQPREVLAGA